VTRRRAHVLRERSRSVPKITIGSEPLRSTDCVPDSGVKAVQMRSTLTPPTVHPRIDFAGAK